MNKRITLLATLLLSHYSQAGVGINQSKVFVGKETKADGNHQEFSSGKELDVEFTNLGLHLSVKRFQADYYYSNSPDFLYNQDETGFLLRIDKQMPTFTVGNKVDITIRYQKLDAGYNDYFTAMYKVSDIPDENGNYSYEWRPAERKITLTRNANGEFVIDDPDYERIYRSSYYSQDERYEYVEMFIKGDAFMRDISSTWPYSWEGTAWKPIIMITASNSSANAAIEARISQMNALANPMNAPWNVYTPAAEDYISELPDVAPPVVQAGINVQAGKFDTNIAITTDFSSLQGSWEPGASINYDVEVEGFVNVYNTSDIDEALSGPTVTASGDVGLVGGQVMFDDQLNVVGGGITIGFGGLPDYDMSVNYPFADQIIEEEEPADPINSGETGDSGSNGGEGGSGGGGGGGDSGVYDDNDSDPGNNGNWGSWGDDNDDDGDGYEGDTDDNDSSWW